MAKQKAARINTATHNPKRKGPSDQQEGLFLNKKAKNICWKCVLHESEKIGHEALRGQYESGTLDPKFYHKFHQAQNETERKSRDLLKNRWIKSKIHKKMTESTGLKEPDESCNDETLANKYSHEFSRLEDTFDQLDRPQVPAKCLCPICEKNKKVKPVSLPANSKRQRIAILGGSFDPITDAHLKAASEIIHCQAADRVWIIPCGKRPDKKSLITPCIERITMCHLAIDTMFGSSFPLQVKDFELHLSKAAPTVQLNKYCRSHFPQFDFKFIIGSDLIQSLSTWSCAVTTVNVDLKFFINFAFLECRRMGPPSLTARRGYKRTLQ
eukprot:m.233748 g.233748  ORF g.233748 m.233748 type:complete len:326 (+) comp16029_c0_seq4:83-1060(+)